MNLLPCRRCGASAEWHYTEWDQPAALKLQMYIDDADEN